MINCLSIETKRIKTTSPLPSAGPLFAYGRIRPLQLTPMEQIPSVEPAETAETHGRAVEQRGLTRSGAHHRGQVRVHVSALRVTPGDRAASCRLQRLGHVWALEVSSLRVRCSFSAPTGARWWLFFFTAMTSHVPQHHLPHPTPFNPTLTSLPHQHRPPCPDVTASFTPPPYQGCTTTPTSPHLTPLMPPP